MTLRVGCRADDADKHANDVNSLIYHKGKLYSGGDDGKIKAWTSDLTKVGEVQAHVTSIYSLAANEDTLFSASNDGTVRAFDPATLVQKEIVIKDETVEFWKVFYSDNILYVGDSEGNVKLWKNGKSSYSGFNLAEPVKDMAVSRHILYSAKETDLAITEVKTEGEHVLTGSKNTFVGRAPIALVGDKLVAFTSREGKDIIIHENNDATHFKEVTKVLGASELIINTLAGASWNNKSYLFSGGWDKLVKKWSIEDDIVKLDGQTDVSIVVNTIAIGESSEIYAGGSDGHIVRVEIE